MVIIIDFDNTVAATSVAAIKYIRDKYRAAYADQTDSIDVKELLWSFKPYVRETEVEDAINYISSKEFFEKLEPMPEVKNALARLSSEHELILCTNRTGVSFDLVKEWLDRQGLKDYFSHIICVSSFDKSPIVGNVIIDDKYECVKGGDRNYRILFGNYRYTRDELYDGFSKDPNTNTYRKCSNWDEVLRLLG